MVDGQRIDKMKTRETSLLETWNIGKYASWLYFNTWVSC